MSPQFQRYVANINRVSLGALIDYHEAQSRLARAKPSLIVQPLTGEFYGTTRLTPASVQLAAGN
jgi:hypothetical protein